MYRTRKAKKAFRVFCHAVESDESARESDETRSESDASVVESDESPSKARH
jgi:hypothetical protein